MKINRQVKVIGKVQGVFFRKSTQEKARQLNVTGWVKNQSDGSVLAELEGTPTAILQMKNWLQSGPERAVVEELKIQEGELREYVDFEVLR